MLEQRMTFMFTLPISRLVRNVSSIKLVYYGTLYRHIASVCAFKQTVKLPMVREVLSNSLFN